MWRLSMKKWMVFNVILLLSVSLVCIHIYGSKLFSSFYRVTYDNYKVNISSTIRRALFLESDPALNNNSDGIKASTSIVIETRVSSYHRNSSVNIETITNKRHKDLKNETNSIRRNKYKNSMLGKKGGVGNSSTGHYINSIWSIRHETLNSSYINKTMDATPNIIHFYDSIVAEVNNRIQHHSLNVSLTLRLQSYYNSNQINSSLISSSINRIVFYVWCGKNRHLGFSTYISVVSAMSTYKPSVILFYYEHLPVLDQEQYNTWYLELVDIYPHFISIPLTEADNGCQGENPNTDFILRRLAFTGGLYMSGFTILTHNYHPLKHDGNAIMYGKTHHGRYAFIQSNNFSSYETLKNKVLKPTQKSDGILCEHYSIEHNFSNKHISSPCLYTDTTFFPKDIWELNSPFGNLIRQYFYGSEKINTPRKDYGVLAPNIAHMVWIGGGEMDFLFYLSVLSLVYVAEVDMVYIHGEKPPSGEYWQKIQHNTKVKHVYKEVPETIFGTKVKVISHISDYWRAEFMVNYGGIYVDTDTIFVRKLDDNIRAFDAVGTYDTNYPDAPFPDNFNFGAVLGKRNATYWRLFLESFKWFIDTDWGWNGLRQPYRIKERNPDLIHVEPHLQVICFSGRCNPSWWPRYKEIGWRGLKTHLKIRDWQKEAYVFHWTTPTPCEYQSEELLMHMDSMFAEIGKFVLHKAGILISDNRTIIYPDGEVLYFKIKNDDLFDRQPHNLTIILSLSTIMLNLYLIYSHQVLKCCNSSNYRSLLLNLAAAEIALGCVALLHYSAVLSTDTLSNLATGAVQVCIINTLKVMHHIFVINIMFTFMLIAASQCIASVFPVIHLSSYWRLSFYPIIVCSWILAVLLVSINPIIRQLKSDDFCKQLYEHTGYNADVIHKVAVLTLFVSGGLYLICCFFKIYHRDKSQNISRTADDDPLRRSVMIFALFMLCWSPIFINHLLYNNMGLQSLYSHIQPVDLILLSCIINSVFYIKKHKHSFKDRLDNLI